MDERLKKQLAFSLEIDKEKNIFRQTHLSGNGRNENDAEHAWHMAIMAYLLREYANEQVDISRVMLMCLIHDIVEIDAGDTYAYDEDGLATQKAREDAAKERIYSLLPDDQKKEMIELFDEFEAYETAESRFAHSLDNLQPLILNDSNGGGDWREHNVTAAQVYGRQGKTRIGSEKLFTVTDEIIRRNIRLGNIREEEKTETNPQPETNLQPQPQPKPQPQPEPQPQPQPAGKAMEELQNTVAKLRAPEDGCPWDRVQTHESLKTTCVEEAAEVVCGINILSATGKPQNLREELGDLLLQVVMQAQIAEEEGLFTLTDVIHGINEKMIRRHPHVFGQTASHEANPESIPADWKKIKAMEKAGREWEEAYLFEAFEEAEKLIAVARERKKQSDNK